jgi:hypothetical protein
MFELGDSFRCAHRIGGYYISRGHTEAMNTVYIDLDGGEAYNVNQVRRDWRANVPWGGAIPYFKSIHQPDFPGWGGPEILNPIDSCPCTKCTQKEETQQ